MQEYLDLYVVTFKKYTLFTGRAGLKEFWTFAIATTLGIIVLSIIEGLIPFVYLPLSFFFQLATLLPFIGVGIRRMHDIGKSGWYIAIPLYNLYLAALPSVTVNNPYASDPK